MGFPVRLPRIVSWFRNVAYQHRHAADCTLASKPSTPSTRNDATRSAGSSFQISHDASGNSFCRGRHAGCGNRTRHLAIRSEGWNVAESPDTDDEEIAEIEEKEDGENKPQDSNSSKEDGENKPKPQDSNSSKEDGENKPKPKGSDLPEENDLSEETFKKMIAFVVCGWKETLATGEKREGFFGTFGSGLLVTPDGYVFTNKHVVEEVDNESRATTKLRDIKEKRNLEELKPTIWVFFGQDHKYETEIIHISEEFDFAILKAKGMNNAPHFSLSSSDKIPRGTEVKTLGFPGASQKLLRLIFVEDDAAIKAKKKKVVQGLFSGKRLRIRAKVRHHQCGQGHKRRRGES